MGRKNIPTDVFKFIDMKGGDNEQCWPWKGTTNKKDGRPYFTIDRKRRPSYAIVLELSTGRQQEEGQVVRHNCDNPVCCNPAHLDWGTHQDNMNDMKERERHGLSKIVVRAILKLLSEQRSHSDIAELYGVSRETVTAINNRRTHQGREREEKRLDK